MSSAQIRKHQCSFSHVDICVLVMVGFVLFVIIIRDVDHEIFSTVILSLPLIQEGQLSVSGKRMCTILVNPVTLCLGKLTTLDMTPLG